MNKKKDKKLKGSVLVYMLFLLVTMSAIGLGIMFSAVSNLKNSIVSTNTDNAMSASENGVEMFFFRAKNAFVNNYQPTVTLNILNDTENNVFCERGVVKVNVGGANTAWNERLRFKLEFFKEENELVIDCAEPVINIRHIKSTGYYNNTVRSITMPVSFDFYEKGLIGNWKLDDEIGSSEADNSADGEVPDGELSSSGVEFVNENIEGIERSVLKFSSGGYVEIPDLLGKPKAITLSAWIKPNRLQSSNVISVGDSVQLKISPDSGEYKITGIYNNSNEITKVSDVPMTDSKWHHVAYTVNPTDSKQRIYFDGNLLVQENKSEEISYSGDNTYLGVDNSKASPFTGRMRNVRIYDRELLIPEVKMLHSATWNQ